MSLSIIHLTDIHLSLDESKNKVLTRVGKVIDACKSVIGYNEPCAIVISGDIASSGKEEEYDVAFTFLDELKNQLSCDDHRDMPVYVVPGNHDCDFSEENPVRTRLLETIDGRTVVEDVVFSSIVSVQKNFFAFSELFSALDISRLCNYQEWIIGDKKILFQLVNSAWMSKRHEEYGSIVLPNNMLSEGPDGNYDCVITVMHHPYNWLEHNNRVDFLNFIRKTTDLFIMGHEHREDGYSVSGEKWSIAERYGEELQSTKTSSSGFSIYRFDDLFQTLETYHFSWNGNLYARVREYTDVFSRNTLIATSILIPTGDYIREVIEDPGVIIVHERAENVQLSEIYCWPELEKIEPFDERTSSFIERIKNDIPNSLLRNPLSVVVGDALVGKTALAKMLFSDCARREECCVLLSGEKLNTIVDKNLKGKIEEEFVKEYAQEKLEQFKQLPREKRILIVDDFNNVPYHDERRSIILQHLVNYASKVVILTDNVVDARVVCSKIEGVGVESIHFYRIAYFGNEKRWELARRWYSIREASLESNSSVEEKVSSTSEKITQLLGASRGFIPAAPIYLINFLQNIDATTPAAFSGSQYGFLYDSLINKSLSTIRYADAGALNIDINIMSALAYSMLQKKRECFSAEDLTIETEMFKKSKIVSASADVIMARMKASRLIRELGPNTYKFRYPYILYYFVGRHIAYNLEDPEVKALVSYMCTRLYNEKYGNIIIFVCHFSNSKEIIDEVIEVACKTLEDYEEFEFDKHPEVFKQAAELIETMMGKSNVGADEDVEEHRSMKRVRNDEAGIADGNVCETTDLTDEDASREKELASITASLRTIDVLGQIIKNYPGDISGDVKISIITTIHKLGMRVAEAMLSTLGVLEQGFVQTIIEVAKTREQSESVDVVIKKARELFSVIVGSMVYGMIKKVSDSLCNDSLLVAVNESFCRDALVSQRMIMQDLRLNKLNKPDLAELLAFSDELDKQGDYRFAKAVLQMIVANYLKYNRCGPDIRSRLCAKFNLSDKSILIQQTRIKLE